MSKIQYTLDESAALDIEMEEILEIDLDLVAPGSARSLYLKAKRILAKYEDYLRESYGSDITKLTFALIDDDRFSQIESIMEGLEEIYIENNERWKEEQSKKLRESEQRPLTFYEQNKKQIKGIIYEYKSMYKKIIDLQDKAIEQGVNIRIAQISPEIQIENRPKGMITVSAKWK